MNYNRLPFAVQAFQELFSGLKPLSFSQESETWTFTARNADGELIEVSLWHEGNNKWSIVSEETH